MRDRYPELMGHPSIRHSTTIKTTLLTLLEKIQARSRQRHEGEGRARLSTGRMIKTAPQEVRSRFDEASHRGVEQQISEAW